MRGRVEGRGGNARIDRRTVSGPGTFPPTGRRALGLAELALREQPDNGSLFPGELSLAEPGEPLGEKLGGDPKVGLLEPVERLLKEEIQHNVTSCGAYSRPQPRLVVRLLPCRVAHQRLVQSQIRAACTTSEQGYS